MCVADIKEEHGDPVEHEETGFLGPHSIHIYAKSRETKNVYNPNIIEVGLRAVNGTGPPHSYGRAANAVVWLSSI